MFISQTNNRFCVPVVIIMFKQAILEQDIKSFCFLKRTSFDNRKMVGLHTEKNFFFTEKDHLRKCRSS